MTLRLKGGVVKLWGELALKIARWGASTCFVYPIQATTPLVSNSFTLFVGIQV